MNGRQSNLRIYEQGWDRWADMKRYGPASRWLRSLIGDAIVHVREAPRSILDVGCGEGTNTALLAERFPAAEVTGCDQSPAAIRVAAHRHSRANLAFRHAEGGDAFGRPVDLVSCLEVLEHVDDWIAFLTNLAHCARRYLLLSFPTGRMRPFEANVGHVRNFRRGEVERVLDGLGFEPVSIGYAGFPFYSPLYRDLCQITNAGGAHFTQGTYGWRQRLAAGVIYLAFRGLSFQKRRGDQFVGLFRRRDAASPDS